MKNNKKSVVFSMHTKLAFKLIVIGNKHAGKTSLILRFVKDIFQFNYKVTIGVEFYSKILDVKGEQIALQIWDTAGSDNYKSVVRSFYNFAHCVLLLYQNMNSLGVNIDNWMNQVLQHGNPHIIVILVRTKTDQYPIQNQQQIKIDQILKKYNMAFHCAVSSKNNDNVAQLFNKIACLLSQKYNTDDGFRILVDHKEQSIVISASMVENGERKKREVERCCSK